VQSVGFCVEIKAKDLSIVFASVSQVLEGFVNFTVSQKLKLRVKGEKGFTRSVKPISVRSYVKLP